MFSNPFSQIFRPYGFCYHNLTERKKPVGKIEKEVFKNGAKPERLFNWG